MGETVVETKGSIPGKCLRTILTKAGQQEEVIFSPFSLRSGQFGRLMIRHDIGAQRHLVHIRKS